MCFQLSLSLLLLPGRPSELLKAVAGGAHRRGRRGLRPLSQTGPGTHVLQLGILEEEDIFKKKRVEEEQISPGASESFFLFYLALTCVFLGPTGVLGSCFILISCWPQDGAGESERQQPG